MANEQNLKPIRHLSTEEAKRRGRLGGLKAAETKRRKKEFKELCEAFAEGNVVDDRMIKQMQQLGVNEEDFTNKMALVISLYTKALKGDVRAFEVFRDTIGEKPKEEIYVEDKKINPFEGMSTEELKELIRTGAKGD